MSSPEEQAKKEERNVHYGRKCSGGLQRRYCEWLWNVRKTLVKEKQLCKFRETHGLAEGINLDLTYAVCFNLASMFHLNKMYGEALNTYQLIVKNKQYPQAGRLRVNMGNIYCEQKIRKRY